MGKCEATNKGGTSSQRCASSFLSSQDGEEGDTIQDLIGEIASMEEVLWHPGNPPKCPSDSDAPVDCLLRGWYPLSIDETAQFYLRIESSIVFK